MQLASSSQCPGKGRSRPRAAVCSQGSHKSKMGGWSWALPRTAWKGPGDPGPLFRRSSRADATHSWRRLAQDIPPRTLASRLPQTAPRGCHPPQGRKSTRCWSPTGTSCCVPWMSPKDPTRFACKIQPSQRERRWMRPPTAAPEQQQGGAVSPCTAPSAGHTSQPHRVRSISVIPSTGKGGFLFDRHLNSQPRVHAVAGARPRLAQLGRKKNHKKTSPETRNQSKSQQLHVLEGTPAVISSPQPLIRLCRGRRSRKLNHHLHDHHGKGLPFRDRSSTPLHLQSETAHCKAHLPPCVEKGDRKRAKPSLWL